MDTLDMLQQAPEEVMEEGMSIKELFYILRVRFWWIVAVFILVVAAAVGYLSYVTPMYESQVTILVSSLQRGTDFESLLIGQNTTRISTEVELALTRSNVDSALERLDLASYTSADGLPYTDPRVLGNVRGRTTVTTVRDTNIVRITVTDQNYIFARDFANALAESYNDLLGSIARNSQTVKREFIQSQIPLNEAQLQKAADALGRFREESRYIQLSDKSKLLSEKIAFFQLRREPLSLQLQEAKLLSEVHAENLLRRAVPYIAYEDLLEDVDVQNALRSYKERSRELVLYESIMEGLPNDTERVFVLRSAISQVSKTLLDRIVLLVAPRGLSADLFIMNSAQELATAYYRRMLTNSQIEVLSTIEKSFAEELSQLPILERQLLDLQRDVQLYEALRMRLMELYEEVKIAESAVAGGVTVVDPAVARAVPVSPNKMLIMAVAVLLGVALGVLLALLIEMLDITIKDEGVLKRLSGPNRPLLGWIPLMNFDQESPIPSLVVYNDPLSFEAERYKLIANNISFGTLRKTQRVFSITSPGMGEGKTSIVSNIATSMAMNGMKVLLLDGDLRLPQLERFFNLKKSATGLVDVVTKGVPVEEIIVQPLPDVPTLHLLPPGLSPPIPSAIFNAVEFVELLDHILSDYDYILIDTPPLVFASELMAIAKYVDGLAISVRAGISTKGGLKELFDNLGLAGVNILGVIFNGVIESKKGGYYSSGRYYTYSGSYYARRYYSSRYNSRYNEEGEGERKKRDKRGKVRGGYRSNFIKDLKRREKIRHLGTETPIRPFIEKSSPFEEIKKQKKIKTNVEVTSVEQEFDPLAIIESDPKAKGREE